MIKVSNSEAFCYDKEMADAIIVPGRGVYPDGTLFKDPESRIRKAVRLFQDGVAPKIIMSGGFSYHVKNITSANEAKAMKEYAVSLGMKAENIIEEGRSTHTLANAYFCKKALCEPNDWKDIVIVASGDHIKRVTYVFNKVFGTNYTLRFEKSKRVINPFQYLLQIVHEKASIRLTKKWLDTVNDGDDATIRKLLLSKRPNDTIAQING